MLGPKRLSRAEVVGLLSAKIGTQEADKAVAKAAKKLGYNQDTYDSDQALAILEHLATMPGLLGVVARFAKARAILLCSGNLNTP